MTNGTFVTGSDEPEQIYDFYGFPQALYEIKYKPKGSLELAKQTAKLLSRVNASLNSGWDHHGAWSVLKHMYPKCDIPVVQLSLNAARSEKEHFDAC